MDIKIRPSLAGLSPSGALGPNLKIGGNIHSGYMTRKQGRSIRREVQCSRVNAGDFCFRRSGKQYFSDIQFLSIVQRHLRVSGASNANPWAFSAKRWVRDVKTATFLVTCLRSGSLQTGFRMGYSENCFRIARGRASLAIRKQVSEEPVCRLAFGNFHYSVSP